MNTYDLSAVVAQRYCGRNHLSNATGHEREHRLPPLSINPRAAKLHPNTTPAPSAEITASSPGAKKRKKSRSTCGPIEAPMAAPISSWATSGIHAGASASSPKPRFTAAAPTTAPVKGHKGILAHRNRVAPERDPSAIPPSIRAPLIERAPPGAPEESGGPKRRASRNGL